ncbi:MAG: hypothetical protein ACYTBJ_11130 [Planctomycetota bacterium]
MKTAKTSAIVIVCLIMAASASQSATADDYTPPDWRGKENTTHQRWQFSDAASENLVPVDYSSNPPLGVSPALSVDYNPPDTVWIPSYQEATGVWRLESPGNMTIELPNFDVNNPIKLIWMQITYSAQQDREPFVVTMPFYSDLYLSDKQPAGSYRQATYFITIQPNPPAETIWIQPVDCTTYMDEIVIDTICASPQALCVVQFHHFAAFARHWLDSPCNELNNWCNGADINHLDGVDSADLTLLLDQWLYYCPGGWQLK